MDDGMVEARSGDPLVEQDAPVDQVRVSVIITNYNYGRFLSFAIDSVLAQSHGNVECIVVDDGSTDDSREVVRTYPAVQLVTKTNGGQVSAAIAGIARATGHVVIFLDSDDRLYPDVCATVAAAYDPTVALYQFGLDMVDSDGRRVGSYPDMPWIAGGRRDYVLRHGFFPSAPTSGNAFSMEHVRRMLAEAGSEQRYFVDGYLIFSAPFLGAVRQFDQPSGMYLVHGGNVSLSAGINRVSVEKSLRNALWQRSGVSHALRLAGKPYRDAQSYLTAWDLRYLLILRCCYGVRDIAPSWSDFRVGIGAIVRFATFPRITLLQRIKNMALILALWAGEKSIGRRIVPPRK